MAQAHEVSQALHKTMTFDRAFLDTVESDQREEELAGYEKNAVERYYEMYSRYFETTRTLYFRQDSHRDQLRKAQIVGWSPPPLISMYDDDDAAERYHTFEELEARRDARCAYIAKHTSERLVWEVVGSYSERDGYNYLPPHEIKAINHGHKEDLAVAWYRYVPGDVSSTTRKRECIEYAAQKKMTWGNAQDPDADIFDAQDSDTDVEELSDAGSVGTPVSPRERARRAELVFYATPLESRMLDEKMGVQEGLEPKPYERAVFGRLVRGDNSKVPFLQTLRGGDYHSVLDKKAALEAQLVLELKEASPQHDSIQRELTTHCDSFLHEQNLEMNLKHVHYYEERASYGKKNLAFVHVTVEIKRARDRDRYMS